MDYLQQFFHLILFASTITVSTATDCQEHNYHIDSTQFTWPAAPSNDVWIASNCLDQEKLLVFRKCVNGTWTPNNTEFQMKCKQENVEHTSADCPYNFRPIQIHESYTQTQKVICVRKKGVQYDFITDRSVCVQDSIFTVDLNIEEQSQFMERLTQEFPHHNGLFVQGIRWRYPCKVINEQVYYDVELHDVRCGRFELPLIFNNTVPVTCTQSTCEDVCLYSNITTKPFHQTIGQCSEYIIAKPQNSFLHTIGCPGGYYRIDYDYVETERDKCFSIKIFPQPISIQNITDAKVIESYCNGNIMQLSWGDDIFVFRQLSEKIGLTNGNYCLFGIITNETVKYSDWHSGYVSRASYLFNWDKTMNYSRIIAPGTESYLVTRPNGQWTWALDSVTCITCMVKSSLPSVVLRLKYKIFERRLELEVSNQNYLYKEKSSDLGFICFSLFRGVYKPNLTVFAISDGKYLLEDVGIGQYWCSGHAVINRNHVSNGERLFAYGIWFVFNVVRKCSKKCSFSPTNLSLFIDVFGRNNGYVSIKGSTIVEHEQPISDTEYTFTALLSLTLHASPKDALLSDFLNLTDYELETFLIYDHINKKLTGDSNEMNIKSIKSTEYCLHASTFSVDTIMWGTARIGETVSVSPLCQSQQRGTKLTRTCSGDSVNGLFWEKSVSESHCYTFVSESLMKLYEDFQYPSQATEKFEYVKNLLSENKEILLPVDVFLTSRILLKKSTIKDADMQNIFSIYNSVVQVDENSLQISAFLNSTNVLLDTFDNILQSYVKSSILSSNEFQKNGNYSIHSPLIETVVIDPIVSGISGVALYRSRSIADFNFTAYSLRYIYSNETIQDIMIDWTADKDLVVGSYIPMDLLTTHANLTIVITAFFNDKIFQFPNTTTPNTTANALFKTRSKIISTTILGLDESLSFPHKVPIFFGTNDRSNVSTCSVWNFTSINGWSPNGCNLKEIFDTEFQHIALCECPYSSRIAYLMDSTKHGNTHEDEITMTTVVTSSFSIFTTVVIFLTAVVCKDKQISSKIFINFSLAITLEMMLMILISFNDNISVIARNTIASVVLGSTLHYSALVLHFWMLIFAYFQLKRYVTVSNFNVSYLLLKSPIFGWIVPLVPIITILIIDHSIYIPANKNEFQFYPNGWTLYSGVVAPIVLIILLICGVFVAVLIIIYKESHLKYMIEVAEFRKILLSASLCMTVELTWIFGFLSRILLDSNTLFSYLFYVTATIQGLILLFYFIVFDVRFWE